MKSINGFSLGRTKNQYLSALSANIVMLGVGCAIGWLSPALPLLSSTDTPLLSGPFTMEETSWSGSSFPIGSLIGNLLFTVFVVRVGAKVTLLSLAIPQLASWIFMYFGNVAEHLYASRFLSGLTAGGVQTTIMVYIAQIADDNNRGMLGSLVQAFRSGGILVAYVLGAYLDYIGMSMVFFGITVFFIICFFGRPSTPQYYLEIKAYEKAEQSYKYYKGQKSNENSKDFQHSFERLQTIGEETRQMAQSSMKILFCDPQARKGMIIGIMLAFLDNTCGNFVMFTYASKIFEESGSHLSPNVSSIILAVVQLAGTLVATKCVETQGRKILLITSMLGSVIGLIAMATYSYCESLGFDVKMFTWVPVTSMAFVVFISSVGIIPLGSVCTVEVLPTNVRSIGLTIKLFLMNLFSFVFAGTFPILVEYIQLHGYMFILAIMCAFGVLFIVFYMDETKGKTIDLLREEKECGNAEKV